MAHRVKFSIPEGELANLDVGFKIRVDGVKLGELKVSKDGLWWKGRKKQLKEKMSWKRFDELMSGAD
jgi:hypothetical protein